MSMRDYLCTMARFNRWANGRIADAVGTLDDGDYFADRSAFFGSIHRTLNHILLVDRLWRGRIGGEPFAAESLDQILYDDRDALRAARATEDDIIVRFVDDFDEAALAESVDYKMMSGNSGRDRRDYMLATVLNHAIHHRGQVHCMLSQVPSDPPPLDLVFYLREAEAA